VSLKIIGNVDHQQVASVFLSETGKAGYAYIRQITDRADRRCRQNTRQHARAFSDTNADSMRVLNVYHTLNYLLSHITKIQISATYVPFGTVV